MEPINYLAAMPQINLGQQLTQGLQAGALIGQIEQQRQAQIQAQREAEEKQRRAEAFRTNFSAYLENPSAKGWAALVAENPGMREALGDINKTLSADQVKAEQRDYSELYAALGSDPEIAKGLIDKRIEAARNAGQPTDELEIARRQIDTNPKFVRALAMARLGSLPDGDKIVKSILDVEEGARKEALQPTTLRTAAAGATKAEAEATTATVQAKYAPQMAEQAAKAATFDTVIKEAKANEERLRAQYAPQRVKLEVEQLGASLGLTKAQTGQAAAAAMASRASAAASSASAAASRAAAERERIGLLPPDKRMEAEAKLRSEYSKETKVFQDVREAYRRVNASQDNAVGDLSLIFGFMKMLDPGSVVREGEFATAQNAAGIPERVQNLYNRALRGERLTEGQRKAFKGQAQELNKAAEVQEKVVREGLAKVATGYGLNTQNIFFEQPKEPAPTSTPAPTTKPPTKAEIDAALSKYLPNAPKK